MPNFSRRTIIAGSSATLAATAMASTSAVGAVTGAKPLAGKSFLITGT